MLWRKTKQWKGEHLKDHLVPFARQLGEVRVPRGPQILCSFSYLVLVTRFIGIVFQRVCMFSLSAQVSVPPPFPSHPAKEGLVLLTEFMHRFWSRIQKKMDKERQGQRGKKRRRTCSGKLILVHKIRRFAGGQGLKKKKMPTVIYQLFIAA